MNHKQANEKFFSRPSGAADEKLSFAFFVSQNKKERGNLKKMDETEVYRYKKNPVSEETGQGAAICIC